MRPALLLLLLFLTGLHCTRTEIITALRLPCDCKDYPMISLLKNQKSILIFPRTPAEPYGLKGPSYSGGEVGDFYGICSDSLSVSIIKQGKFTDSTAVLFDGWALDPGRNGSIDCYKRGAVRVVKLAKVP